MFISEGNEVCNGFLRTSCVKSLAKGANPVVFTANGYPSCFNNGISFFYNEEHCGKDNGHQFRDHNRDPDAADFKNQGKQNNGGGLED